MKMHFEKGEGNKRAMGSGLLVMGLGFPLKLIGQIHLDGFGGPLDLHHPPVDELRLQTRQLGLREAVGCSGDLDAARRTTRLGAGRHVDGVAKQAEATPDLAHYPRHHGATVDAWGE